MIGVAIDALVLVFLLQTINDDNIGFGSAFLVALVAAVGTGLLAFGLVLAMGLAGVFVAAVVAAILLAIAVSAIYGVEIKRAFLIAGLFMVVHIGVGMGIQMLFAA